MTRNEIMTSTIKPVPPPKPSHLSSAFTGTLSPDALRSYIRQQSINTITNKQLQYSTQHVSSTLETILHRTNMTRGTVDEERAEGGDEEEEAGDTIWGTARQRQHTPPKPAYGKLANLFRQDEAFDVSSRLTITPTSAACASRKASEESTGNVSTIKISKKEREARSNSPIPRRARASTDQTSYSSSSVGTQRSRQPSVLSRLSAFSDDYSEADDYFLNSEQQETPKKKWMHIQDGSAFERAGPTTAKGKGPIRVEQGTACNSVANLTEVVAGPPPLRPCSIAIDFSEEVEKDQQEHSQENLSKRAAKGKAARALYAFTGEGAFNELSLFPGQCFQIINEDVGGGWSLATANEGADERRGLVPRGWYTYVQEFSRLPFLSMQHDSSAKSLDESFQTPSHQPSHQPLQDTASVHGSSLSSLSPLAPSACNTSLGYGGGGVLSSKDALLQQILRDRSRPASGIGQVYSEAGAAVQALTHMHRSNSTPSYTAPNSGSTLLRSAIKGNEAQDASLSESSLERDEAVVSKSATSLIEETDNLPRSPKVRTLFTSPWKASALFGGRSLNRYVPFVTSGAEEYVLFGKAQEPPVVGSNDRFDVVSSHHGYPSWKDPGLAVVVEVHSTEVHTDDAGKEYTAYIVYSSYTLSSKEVADYASSVMRDPHVRPQHAAHTSSVYRRFNQFRWLSSYLGKLFPALMLSMPPFPGTSYGACFDPLFVRQRQRQLQTWLSQVVRHPVLSNEAAVRFFLDSGEEGREWKMSAQKIQQHEADARHASVLLFSKTFHPLFNVDLCESEVETSQMAAFVDAYERGLATPDTGVLASFKAIRQTTAGTSDSYRQLSYSLLRLITGSAQMAAKPGVIGTVPTSQPDSTVTLPPMGNVGRRDDSGATNEERAWCWREGCKECKRLTLSLQETAEALQTVADIYENHSNAGLFELHDRLATMARVNSQHTALLEVHRATLRKYRQATGEGDSLPAQETGSSKDACPSVPVDAAMEQMAARCESVVNVAMSEIDRIHTERCQDWSSLHSQFLDAQIDFYEDVLSALQSAKRQCKPAGQHEQEEAIIAGEGPILPSPYESHLAAPYQASPLVQPDPSCSSSSYFNIWK